MGQAKQQARIAGVNQQNNFRQDLPRVLQIHGEGADSLGYSMLDPENILTPQELAERLKVPLSWVFEKTRARCRNQIPCLRIGRYVRFDWTAVVTWLKTGEADAIGTNLQEGAKLVPKVSGAVSEKRRDRAVAGL